MTTQPQVTHRSCESNRDARTVNRPNGDPASANQSTLCREGSNHTGGMPMLAFIVTLWVLE
jgi:hypothetical protein